MRVYLALTILTLSLLSASGCGAGYGVVHASSETSQSPDRQPPPPIPTPGKGSDPNACWIYASYELVPCSTLVARSSLTGAEKTAYTYPATNDARYKAPVWLIDLKKISPEVDVTKNFKLGEFISSSKGRYAFVAEHLFGFVQTARDRLGAVLQITSGYRSPAYNKANGGVSFSRHVFGDAVDVASPTASIKQMQTACRNAGASYIQLYNDGHVHCDWRNHALDDTFFRTTKPSFIDPDPSELSEEEFKQMQVEMSGEVSIALMSGQMKKGSSITLLGSVSEQEESDALHAQWTITQPDGNKIEAEQNPLVFKLRQAGKYRFEVTLGGYNDSIEDVEVK